MRITKRNIHKMRAHKFSLDIPDETYHTLKTRAHNSRTAMKNIVLQCLNEFLGNTKQTKEISDFVAISNQIFAEEWNSDLDEKAFLHLQKYKPKHQ